MAHGMASRDPVVVVDDLLARPFPPEVTPDRLSGPGYHVRVLRSSRDFWEDLGEEIVEAAEEEIGAAFQGVTTALTARWGRPETVDLTPYLWSEEPVPGPIDHLCMLSSTMLVWRLPETGRWIALTVGQQDPEFPIELLAAIGEASLA
jgi:hypothetical protein